MKKFKFLLLFALLATAFVACDDKEKEVEKPVLPTVEVEAGEAAETTLTFTVTSTEADVVKYIVLEAGSHEVTAELILANGNTATANEAYEATAEGLVDNTTYEIWAAAQNKDGVALSEKVEMTTLEEEAPQPEVEEVLAEGVEAFAEVDGGNTVFYIECGNYGIDVVWAGEEKVVELSSEDGSLLVGEMTIYDRTVGAQEVALVEVVSGSFYTEEADDEGNYYAEGELYTNDNRKFIVAYWGPVEGWSENGGGEPVVAEEVFLPSEGLTWDIMGDVLGMTVTAVDANYENGFSFYVNIGAEGYTYLPTGQYLATTDQAAVDAAVAEYGMAPGEWMQWVNTAGAVFMYEGEYYEGQMECDVEHALAIETLMPEEDLTSFQFCFLSADKAKEFYFGYMGAIYGIGGGDDENITRYDYSVAYDEIADFSTDGTYTTVKFQGMYDMHLSFLTNGGELATTEGWTEYDVATQMDLEKSVYMEFGLDEIVWHLQSGTIGVKKSDKGYVFNFFEVKTGKGDVVNYGLNLITHDQGFDAALPEVEPVAENIKNCIENPGAHNLDAVSVAALAKNYMILADNTGCILAYTYGAADQFIVGDVVSVSPGNTTVASSYVQFDGSSIITKVSNGTYTAPSPYDVTSTLDSFFATHECKYVAVTGTVSSTSSMFGGSKYYLNVAGQTTQIYFEAAYATADVLAALEAANGTETTVYGYPAYAFNETQMVLMPTQVGADDPGAEDAPVDVTFAPTMGIAQAAGSDFYIDLIDQENGIQAGIYVEMQGILDMYYMDSLPLIPSGPLMVASETDKGFVLEMLGFDFYIDADKSYIMYNGKEYKLAVCSESQYSAINLESYYDGATPEYDINILRGDLYATDGSVFHVGFQGALYTNSMIGGM